jgi:hypothetical protein
MTKIRDKWPCPLPLDFETWSRENLVRLVQEVWADNKKVHQENVALHEAWHLAVKEDV